MAFVVLYDACVLYPAPLRDLLIRLANTGIVRARGSATILDECFRNILANRPDLRPEALNRTRELMRQAVPDCMVSGAGQARNQTRAEHAGLAHGHHPALSALVHSWAPRMPDVRFPERAAPAHRVILGGSQ